MLPFALDWKAKGIQVKEAVTQLIIKLAAGVCLSLFLICDMLFQGFAISPCGGLCSWDALPPPLRALADSLPPPF